MHRPSRRHRRFRLIFMALPALAWAAVAAAPARAAVAITMDRPLDGDVLA